MTDVDILLAELDRLGDVQAMQVDAALWLCLVILCRRMSSFAGNKGEDERSKIHSAA